MKISFLIIFTLLFTAAFSSAQDKLELDDGSSALSSRYKGARTNMIDPQKSIQYQSNAASIFVDDMNGDNTVTGLEARGWIVLNEDGGGATDPMYQGVPATFNAYEGPDAGYVAANFNGANSSGVIDQWLISPEITVEDGDVLKFWFRAPDNNPFDDSIFVHYSKDAKITPNDFGESWGRFLVSETGWAQWVGAFNHNETVRFAIQYYIEDGGPNGLYSNYIGLDLFEVSKPCPIDIVTNPSPSDGALDIPVTSNDVHWLNGAGADSISVYFGEIDNLQLIYNGAVIDSLNLSIVEPLNCNTTYIWQVVGKNDTCQVLGPNWTFTTIPSPVGSPSAPSPTNGAIDVPIIGNTAMWTNGVNTVTNRVYFGEPGSLTLVYDGPAITSLSLASVEPLSNNTNYTWQVISEDDFCETGGPVWTFRTERDSNAVCVFMDDFTDTTNWSAVNLNDPCDWGYSNTLPIPGSSWGAPNFPVTADNFYAFASSDACGDKINVNFTGNFTIDASLYQTVWIEFDSDFEVFLTPDPPDTAAVDVSINAGLTWTRIFLREIDAPVEHAIVDISDLAGLQADIRFRLYYYGDFSWHWALDNFAVYLDDLLPPPAAPILIEPLNNAQLDSNTVKFVWHQSNAEVTKYWIELDTTDQFTTSFVDSLITDTTYLYSNLQDVKNYWWKVKALNSIGWGEFSEVGTFNVIITSVEEHNQLPTDFTLEQNYPNPFNPSTNIRFSLAADSRVTLKIFDILGQEVVTVINGNLSAGSHNIDFSAASAAGGLNSGIYFYRLYATDTDGGTFTSIKKMILIK